jgi:rRNA maturation endonuclease Nob1
MTRKGAPYTDAERLMVRALWSGGTPTREDLENMAVHIGRSVSSVKNMASFLGVSADGRRRAERAAAKPRTRLKCLRCAKEFMSEHRATNRICGHCKSSADWRTGPPDASVMP